jgi:hypothetical protein
MHPHTGLCRAGLGEVGKSSNRTLLHGEEETSVSSSRGRTDCVGGIMFDVHLSFRLPAGTHDHSMMTETRRQGIFGAPMGFRWLVWSTFDMEIQSFRQ